VMINAQSIGKGKGKEHKEKTISDGRMVVIFVNQKCVQYLFIHSIKLSGQNILTGNKCISSKRIHQ
jgi:hypothetical protein